MKKSLEAYEKELRKRHSRWSPGVWEALVRDKIPKLQQTNEGLKEEERDAIIEGYIRLCSESIGLGRLYPNANNIHELVLLQKVPELLNRCGSAKQQLEMLVDLWNLCDILEDEPRWISKLMVRTLQNIESLEQVSAQVMNFMTIMDIPTDKAISELQPQQLKVLRISSLSLGFFLPLGLEMIAPPILQVTGRTPDQNVSMNIYVPDGSILSIEKVPAEPITKAEIRGSAPLISSLDLPLKLKDYTENHVAAAAVFQDSQSIWLWTRKDQLHHG